MAKPGQPKCGRRHAADSHAEKLLGKMASELARLTTRVMKLENAQAERALIERETRHTDAEEELVGTGFPKKVKP